MMEIVAAYKKKTEKKLPLKKCNNSGYLPSLII
jgi:hypothetical protein